MAVTMPRRSPPTSVMSEAAIATSVPVPMAMPRSAWASAGASLMPSPTIATTLPCAWSAWTLSAFCSGSTSASTWSMPTSRAIASAVARLSPVSIHTSRPSACSCCDRLAPTRAAACRPRRSGPAGWPPTATYIGVAPARASASALLAEPVELDAVAVQQRAVAEQHLAGPRRAPGCPGRRTPGSAPPAAASSPSSRARATIASPSGCSEPTSAAAASRSRSCSLRPLVGHDLRSRPACRA